jgi:hypothetical protein
MTTCSLIACNLRPHSGQVYVAGFRPCARLTAHHSVMAGQCATAGERQLARSGRDAKGWGQRLA